MAQRRSAALCLAAGTFLQCIWTAWAQQQPVAPGVTPSFSEMWGQNGERFTPNGRLLDYSFSGYMGGDEGIPTLVPTHSVKDFGAKGDGQTDDTRAFATAIATIPEGSVLGIPEGKYVLTYPLTINKRISIKGAGSGSAIIVVPKSLKDIFPNFGADTFSFRGAFFQIEGRPVTVDENELTTVTAAAAKGDNTIKVASTAGMAVGEWILVTQGSPTNRDWRPMMLGLPGGCVDSFCYEDNAFAFPSRVAQVVDGTTVVLERPLPYDLYANFNPKRVWRFRPRLANIGIEGLGFLFLAPKYQGHITEKGWNAIEMQHVSNSWIRDIQTLNTDLAINVLGCYFVTITAVRFMATPERLYGGEFSGHHGVILNWCNDCLLTYFDISTVFYHDVQVNKFSTGVVVSYGRGVDLNMDHHRGQNYGTLWTQLDFGKGSRAFHSGGSSNRGVHAGAYTTFWNLAAAGNQLDDLDNDLGPGLNFVGIAGGTPFPSPSPFTATWKVENIAPGQLFPPNLYAAMWRLRVNSPGKVSPALGHKGQGGGKPLSTL